MQGKVLLICKIKLSCKSSKKKWANQKLCRGIKKHLGSFGVGNDGEGQSDGRS